MAGKYDDALIHQFNGGGGLTCSEISFKDNAVATTLNSATGKVQVTNFDTNGLTIGQLTPDHTNDHITIGIAGYYWVTINLTVKNNAAQTHVIDVSVFKNNGATEFTNVHSHRTLSGGVTDIGSIALHGIISCAVSDTIELWADTSAAANRSVTFEDCTLSIFQVGSA